MKSLLLRKKDGGYSLLETLVASFIFLFVVVAITTVWVWYGKAVAVSRYVLVGTQLGEQVIEQCMDAGFEHVDELATPVNTATGGTGTPLPPGIKLKTTLRGQVVEVEYHTVVKVTKPVGSPALKNVAVEVSWEDEKGPEVIKFETVLFHQL